MAKFVWNRRKPYNTVFIYKQFDDLKNWFYPHIERIIKSNKQNPTAPNSNQIQFKIPQYNAIMFSKLSLMSEALQHDKFNTDIVMWIDAGIMNYVIPKSFSSPKQQFIKKIFEFIQPQWIFFCCLQCYHKRISKQLQIYQPKTKRQNFRRLPRGICIGCKRFKTYFQNFLRITLQNGDMDSDEIIYDMMPFKYPYLIPATTNRHYKQLYKKYQINRSVNRKPQIVRQFKGRFDEQQNLLIFKYFEYEDHALRAKQLIGLNKQVELLRKENDLYKSIFYRQTLFFTALLFIYAIMLLCQCQKNYAYEQSQKINFTINKLLF